jgi:flagellar protein FlbD
MIQLTRLNHSEFYLNPDLIELMDTTPDTVISLSSGHKYVVLESAQEVIDRIVTYRQRCAAPRVLSPEPPDHPASG